MSDILPLFPLATALFPGMVLPLHIFEARYRKLLVDRRDDDPIFGVVLTRSGREVGDRPEIYEVGATAALLAAAPYPDGRSDIVVQGKRRFRVLNGTWDTGYLTATVAWLDGAYVDVDAEPNGVVAGEVRQAFIAYLEAFELVSGRTVERPALSADPLQLGYAICSMMPFDLPQRQRLLETGSQHLLPELLTALRRERKLLATTGIGGVGVAHPGARLSEN
jgi:Lon protease-like protein